MDYDGLMIKYKYRASSILTEEEMSHQLRQHEPIDLQGKRVMDDTAVIHLSSNYVEIVDKYYSVKGFLTVPSLAGGGLCVWFACSFYYTMFVHYFFDMTQILGFIFPVLLWQVLQRYWRGGSISFSV